MIVLQVLFIIKFWIIFFQTFQDYDVSPALYSHRGLIGRSFDSHIHYPHSKYPPYTQLPFYGSFQTANGDILGSGRVQSRENIGPGNFRGDCISSMTEVWYPVSMLVIMVCIVVKLYRELTEDNYIAESTNKTVKLHFFVELIIQAEE